MRRGLVDDHRTTTGSDGLSIGTGDVIQTRQNDADVQVANRQPWTVQSVGNDGTVWAKENGAGRKRQRTVRLPAEYMHLADASGVDVGVTRGRELNLLHIVADDVDHARER
ncbi:MAG: hypothetical protein ACK5IN_09280 [Microbacterium sp.]|uniref:hypothetical protein n=1 Tax=Microbacterium sp. TaxID=51671 RepID=UPI003A8AEA4D